MQENNLNDPVGSFFLLIGDQGSPTLRFIMSSLQKYWIVWGSGRYHLPFVTPLCLPTTASSFFFLHPHPSIKKFRWVTRAISFALKQPWFKKGKKRELKNWGTIYTNVWFRLGFKLGTSLRITAWTNFHLSHNWNVEYLRWQRSLLNSEERGHLES